MDRLVPLLWLWLLFFSVNTAWALSQAAVASLLGARPVSVDLGMGPILLSNRLGGVVWNLRPFAIGSAVGFTEEPEDAPKRDRLKHLSTPLYAAVILLPWAVPVALAMATLGVDEALHQLVHGFTVPFEFSALPGRVERFFVLLEHGELLRAWGLLNAKMAALNLLPLSFFAGGQLLRLPWRNREPRWLGTLHLLSFLVGAGWGLYVIYVVLTVVF
ncbi:hypothetical protein [Pyxidicoccus xibeiensis]|uniref:hypothetical protein n=1 Tax=Pyxidicoccus xibeiensis TaxID=2906759 RepID=UPI0020A72732|nr:hypothetical protein [Pyxidicoccus xibeiensis]MCP3140753.1 hypothetical protein [Pyxidicoccus xibeiensis]